MRPGSPFYLTYILIYNNTQLTLKLDNSILWDTTRAFSYESWLSGVILFKYIYPLDISNLDLILSYLSEFVNLFLSGNNY